MFLREHLQTVICFHMTLCGKGSTQNVHLLDKTQKIVPQILKQVVYLSCYLWNTGLETEVEISALKLLKSEVI